MMYNKDLYSHKGLTQADVTELLQEAARTGVRHIDYAQSYVSIWWYMFGRRFCWADSAELKLGKAACLNKWVHGMYKPQITSKIGGRKEGGGGYRYKDVKEKCYQSIKDLGVDYLQIY